MPSARSLVCRLGAVTLGRRASTTGHERDATMSGSRSSAVTRVAAVALLAAAVTFVLVSLRDPGYVHLYLAGDRVDLAAHRELATFVVEGPPFSLVELSVNGRRAGSAYVAWNGRTVRFEGTPLDDGRNVVVARTTLWYAASRRAHATALRVDNPPAAIAEHRTMRRDAAPAAPQSRNGRSLALRIRQQEVDAAFAVQLPQTDPAIVALRSNRSSLPEFVDAVFGSPRFNRKPIASFFTGAASQLYVADQTVTVSADSGYQRLGLEDLPAFAGEVEIANAFIGPRISPARGRGVGPASSARSWGNDVLRLRVDDYRVDRSPARTARNRRHDARVVAAVRRRPNACRGLAHARTVLLGRGAAARVEPTGLRLRAARRRAISRLRARLRAGDSDAGIPRALARKERTVRDDRSPSHRRRDRRRRLRCVHLGAARRRR